jgi:hypothetical protein
VRTVHKYPLEHRSDQHTIVVRMPMEAEPLHVDVQNSSLFLWALVETERPLQNHEIEVYGTGHDTARDIDTVTRLKHLGTVLMHHGALVLHFFTREGTFEDQEE